MSYISKKENDIILTIYVKPNSKQRAISLSPADSFLTLSLKSPPDKGKANKELVKYLANIFSISSSSVLLASGQTSRDKQVLIKNVTVEYVQTKLNEFQKKTSKKPS